ncbi:hypothetical protein Q3G72_035412 [Acer saccharum]|nr:hypothetical protein Q3G72_035412 [Acer saccharum]
MEEERQGQEETVVGVNIESEESEMAHAESQELRNLPEGAIGFSDFHEGITVTNKNLGTDSMNSCGKKGMGSATGLCPPLLLSEVVVESDFVFEDFAVCLKAAEMEQ